MYRLMRKYGLTRIRYPLFCIYMISDVLAISHVITDFRYSNLPIFCVTWTHTYPMPYIFTYTAFTNYTAFSICNLSTVPGVTPTHSCGHISEWDLTLIEYTYFLVRMTSMIRSLNFLNRFPWSCLVIKSPVTPFMGHNSTVILSLGLTTEVPKLTHYWVVLFHPRASAKVTSRLCPFIVLVCYVIYTRVSLVFD